MKRVLSSSEAKNNDRYTIKKGTSSLLLMERAGIESTKIIKEYINKDSKVLILCGSGGNGGDGYAISRLLFDEGYNVSIYELTGTRSIENETNRKKYNGPKTTVLLDQYDLIVDSIFGIGLSRNLDTEMIKLINTINSFKGFKVSIDINSGLNSNNGKALPVAFKSDLTIGIEEYKLGYFLNDGKDYIKNIKVVKIGIEAIDDINYVNILDNNDYKDLFIKRKSNSNKGSNGKAVIIGGSYNFPGAPLLSLSSLLSLKMGSGYTCLSIPKSLYSIYALKNLETIYYPFSDQDGYILFDKEMLDNAMKYDSIALGMGLTTSFEVYKSIKYLIDNYSGNLIIDADGLNSLSKYSLDILAGHKCNIIMTPHIKEFSRLINLSVDEINNNSIELAKEFASKYNVILVLKSNSIIITDGSNTYLEKDGSPALAKGGSGDLLSGYLVGLLTKNDNLLKRCACATYLLNKSVNEELNNQSEYSINASDIVKNTEKIIKDLQN